MLERARHGRDFVWPLRRRFCCRACKSSFRAKGDSMKRIFFSAIITLLWVPSSRAQRLPDNVIPESYDLNFEPDLSAATFSGDETIHVRLLKAATSVVLNSAEIEIKEASIASGDFKQAAFFKTDDKLETATITVPNMVPAGPAEIHIRFTGILNDKLRGFYLSQTARRRYAVTQFEATDARRAFPSFDEPDKKATFDITLVVDKGDTAISNEKLIADTPGPGDGKHTLHFATTKKLSSYLVAMLVGDFQCIDGSADNTPIRACATPDKKDDAKFALEAAEYVLHYYNDYFGIPYPFGKLDLIAVPDFEAGAMENA